MEEFWIRVKTEEQLEAALEADFADNIILEAGMVKYYLDSNGLRLQSADRRKFYFSLPDIARESQIENIIEILDENTENFDGVCIKNIDEIGLLRKCGCKKKIIVDEFLYAYNAAAIGFYRSVFEDIDFIAPAELTLKELARLEKNADVNFIYKIYGHQKLMITAQCFGDAYSNCKEKNLSLHDEKGEKFDVSTECENCFDVIYNGIPTYMADKLSEFGKNSRLLLDFTTESSKETEEILDSINQILQGRTCEMPEKFTRGHYYSGVE